MNVLIKRLLGESVAAPSKDVPMPIIEKTRPETYDVCPHCQQEIFEKHTYIDGDYASGNYVERHSDCGGALKRKPTDWSQVSPEWRSLLGIRECACPHCQKKFEYASVSEVKMGAVKCPHCDKTVTQGDIGG